LKIKYIAICLVLLCCIMGTASATEDISTDIVSDSVDDVAVDAVQEEISDSSTVDETSIGGINDDTKADELIENSVTTDSEKSRASSVTVSDWDNLSSACSQSSPQTIYLSGAISSTSQITFLNSATIIGNPGSYITGGKNNRMAFVSSGDYSVTFKNVTFRNMKASVLIKMSTTGVNKFINCSFDNITTSIYKSSVIWNDGGLMNIDGCNFTNCNNGFGTITNYATSGSATMTVDNCRFENNYGRVEPGAINNCGIMNVTNCTFINNRAYQWAGAIHTHSDAETIITNSNFTNNNAGWNGGALYSYSKLKVINSTFTNNTCNSSAGGGAIGCSNWGSSYNITICNCNFTDNANLCGHTNETPSTGTGGAISAMNNGILKVCGSTFVHNVAAFGQAIAAYSQGYISPEGNISEGIPKVIICNNTFINHTLNTSNTVELSGDYTFENNTFNHCHQTNDTNNIFIDPVASINPNNPISQEVSCLKTRNVLSSTDLEDNDYYIVTIDEDQISNLNSILSRASRTASENQDILVYLPLSTFGYPIISTNVDDNHNYFFVSSEKGKTIINSGLILEGMSPGFDDDNTMTFINITFESIPKIDLSNHKVFINCTFIDTEIIANNDTYQMYLAAPENVMGITQSIIANFTDCLFVNTNITSYIFTQTNFVNCTFKDINANSLVYTNTDGGREDGVYIKNCTFENITVNGIIDYKLDNEDLYSIEDCDYDFVATVGAIPSEDNSHHYLNATKLKPVVAVDSVVDISSSEKGVVVITLTDNSSAPIAGATVKYTVNGGEEQTVTTGEDGKATVSGLTGEVTIAVNYEGNESFNAISDSKFFNFTEEPVVPAKVATKITAPKVTATYNVAKKLVITLTDKDGKALANKKVTVKVGTISKNLTTNAKGQVSLNVATLVPKTYTATVKFAGDDSYLASSVSPKVVVSKAKPKFTAKAKTFKVKVKTKKYTVTLKNNKGKVLKKVKLTLKVGKKTYKATTNSKGKATFKITKLNKKGKYTATVKFAGNKYYNKLSKKVKITVKK